MLAYTASRRRAVERRSSPSAMLVVAVVHVAAIAAVMSARMDLPSKIIPGVTKVELIELPKPPPPPEVVPPKAQPRTAPSVMDRVPVIVPVPQPKAAPLDSTPIPVLPPMGDVVGPKADPLPQSVPRPVRIGPRFATPDHALRPPYPRSKIDSGEEAVLKLRLSIDARGRVTSVEPVGRADPAFLEAARRHLTARWRYKPATEGGHPVAASTVITLRFELE